MKGKEEVRWVFHPTPLILLTRTFAHITNFDSRNLKNCGPKNQSHHSGSQMGPFELRKVKTPPQYWFHISTTWWSVSALMCRPVMGTRKNSNFPSRLIVFLLLFKVLLYNLRLFVSLSGICFFFLSTWIVTDKINALFSITLPWQLLHTVCFLLLLIQLYFMIWIRIVLPSNEHWVNEYFV